MAAEWMADPDGDPSTADFHGVNASWSAGGAGEALRPIIARWRELGIVPVFAAGNTGRTSPLRRSAESLAVGAVGPRGQVARFSRAASRASPVRRGR